VSPRLSLPLATAARLLVLLALAAPALSQAEKEPYFSLFTNHTFPSNGKPTVQISAVNVDSLEFRVYRINDPLKFFQQLENPHQFGGRAPAPPRDRTLLERIHSWKHSLRTDIRRSLRAQFTESPSAHFESLQPHAAAPTASRGTYYAETPVLNSQQLVLSFVQPVQGHSRWESETIPIGVQQKGVYLVEAVRHDLRAYTVLMVSDAVMVTKVARGRIINLMVDRATGEPIPSAKVWMLTKDGQAPEAKITTQAETNPDGMAEIPLPSAQLGARLDDVRIIGQSGGRHGADFATNSLAAWSFNANTDEFRGFVYTDRPVYRPGHTVHFKAIFRMRTSLGYTVPAGKSVSVQIQDPEQKPVYQKTLTTTAGGTIHDDLVLGPAAALGSYSIEAHFADNFANANFDVEEYKKPEYEVRVTPSKTRVLQGETVQAAIDSRYYFGEPVAGAKVEYAIYRDHYYFPLWYDPEDDYGLSGQDDSDSSGDQVDQGEGQLDADGKLTVNIPTKLSDHKLDYMYSLEARVTDQGKREITGKGWILATYGSFVLNASPDRYFYQPGGKAVFTIQSRDYDSKPVRARAHVELLRWNWRDKSQSSPVAAADVDTGPGGSAPAELAIPSGAGGTYRVHVTARTPENRDVESYSFIWVSGGGRADFGSGADDSIKIVPDRKSYQAGDTARLMIVTGQPRTPLYVSVEGRDVRQFKLLRSGDSTAVFEVPVTAADEPGISVTAEFVRKGVTHAGDKYIKVPPVSHQLNVKLATDKPQYQPGQTAEYSIDVTGADGQPAPRAEFSLGVVDEAIYAIRKDTTPDPLSFFFGRDFNAVYTTDSLAYFFNGEAGKRRMRLADLRPPSRLAQLKPERLVQPKVRKAFPDTAFWATDLVTDNAGHARAKVEFPDSLTTWRATARGATPDTRVGAATLKTIVRKNLILRLVVPRFFVQGDELVISALVHNYLASEKTARVSLDVSGLEVLEGATKDVRIPSRGEATVDWRVRAKQVRSATVTGKALTDEESDALELTLPVNVPGVKLSTSRGGSLSGGLATAYDLTFPPNIEPGSRSLAIRLSPSIAGSLFGALDYLTTYPYGCVEQTMSSFLPNIVVTQAVRDLGLKVTFDEAALQQKVRAGLDRLYNFQHEDGGWGWWETDDSHPFMTAYVVAGLSQAKAAGVQVNQQAIDKGAAWVQKHFAEDSKLAADLRAYMAYSTGNVAHLAQVYDQRAKLSPYGMALLGLGLEQAKDARAAEIAGFLEGGAQQDQEQAWWPATRDPMLDFSMDVTPEATAYVVKLLSHQRKDSPLLPKAALWLMNHRNEGYWWSSTKQTAMVIYGLTDFLKTTNELNSNLNVTVSVNGAPAVTQMGDITLDETKLQPGVNHIHITTSLSPSGGQGRLYYSTRAEYYSTDEKLQKNGTVSLNILRDYFKLVPAKDGDKIVYDGVPWNGPVVSGDILAVRLTVTGSEWKYLMIEDPIPAGTEFVERDNIFQLREKPPWWTYLFTRRELHDDRMTIFETRFPQGQEQYFYLLKVVNPGTFRVSPARVGPMYQTDIMATTESRRLEVK